MRTKMIKSWKDQTVIFEDSTLTDIELIEKAIGQQTDLSYADLSGWNLSGLNLDTAKLRHIRFCNTNLSNSNISEASFTNCDFSHACLVNACMAESNFHACRFSHAQFGATDIFQATLKYSSFAGISWTSLNFHQTQIIEECLAFDRNGTQVTFSIPPIVIQGLEPFPIVLFDDHSLIDNIFKQRVLTGPKNIDQDHKLLTSTPEKFFY